MKIGLDLLGGDFVPESAVEGMYAFLEHNPDTEVVAYADEKTLAGLDKHQDRIIKVPCSQSIDMDENPTSAFKNKQDSTIVRGIKDLAGPLETDAFISAGNSGAMLVSSVFLFQKNLENIRPTISSPLPRIDGDGFNFLLDVGLNMDCKADYLVEFAVMGTKFVQGMYGIEAPEVALLNIGEEEGKGDLLSKEAYELLSAKEGINFIGNIEGRDVFLDKARIIICDGFVGNVILKLSESIYSILHGNRKLEDDFLNQFNYELYGGTPILGLPKPVIIGHGNSSAAAFQEMLVKAEIYTRKGVIANLVSS